MTSPGLEVRIGAVKSQENSGSVTGGQTKFKTRNLAIRYHARKWIWGQSSSSTYDP